MHEGLGISSRQKVLLSLVLLAGAVLLFGRFVLLPQVEAYARVKEELAKEQAELARAQAAVAGLKAEQEKVEELKQRLAELEDYFSAEMRYGGSVFLLGMKAAARNVQVTDLEPGPVAERDYVAELSFKLTVEGDYPTVLEFWRDLENMNRLAELRYARLERAGSSAEEATASKVKGSFTLVLYSTKTSQGVPWLEEAARWLTGRYNLFRPAGSTPPVPELAGRLKLPPAGEAGQKDGSPAKEGASSTLPEGGQAGEPEYVRPK